MPTWSHDGTLLAVADGKEINLHDASTGNVVRTLNSSGHGGAPSNTPPAFTPDDQRVVREVRMRVGTAALKVLDTGSGTELLTLPLPPATGPGTPFVFSADGRRLHRVTTERVPVGSPDPGGPRPTFKTRIVVAPRDATPRPEPKQPRPASAHAGPPSTTLQGRATPVSPPA